MARDDAALLQNTSLFGTLPPDAVRAARRQAVRRSYARGEVIFREDDAGRRTVRCRHRPREGLPELARRRRDAARDAGPSSVFGELPTVDGGLRSASAAAVEATTVLLISRTALLEALRGSPELVDRLLRSLGTMVRRLTDQAADFVFLDLHGRVAKLLLRLADERGTPVPGGRALDLHHDSVGPRQHGWRFAAERQPGPQRL